MVTRTETLDVSKPDKDPWVAAGLQAVLPGVGYLYLGLGVRAFLTWVGVAFLGSIAVAAIVLGDGVAVLLGWAALIVGWVYLVFDAKRRAELKE